LPNAKNDAVSAALAGFDLNSHTLAKATLTGLYGRWTFSSAAGQAGRVQYL